MIQQALAAKKVLKEWQSVTWKPSKLVNALTYHLVFISRLLEEISRSLDVEQNVSKHSNGILVAPHHQVGKAHIVIGGDLALRHTRVHTLQDKQNNREKINGTTENAKTSIMTKAHNSQRGTFLLSSMFSRTLMAW